ncbi:MAG TPA: hypothetical protein VGH28_25835 [Polyangiaceae bacterium]
MLDLLILIAALVSQPIDAGARVSVVFELRTPGAAVRLVHKSDARILTFFPVRINFDRSERWSVTATKPGFCPFARDVDYSRPVFVIALQRGC